MRKNFGRNWRKPLLWSRLGQLGSVISWNKVRDRLFLCRELLSTTCGNRICLSNLQKLAINPPLGFHVTPSHANFLWCRRTDRPHKPIYEALKSKNILIRYMNYSGYDGLRISVGTDAEIDKLLMELRKIV